MIGQNLDVYILVYIEENTTMDIPYIMLYIYIYIYYMHFVSTLVIRLYIRKYVFGKYLQFVSIVRCLT